MNIKYILVFYYIELLVYVNFVGSLIDFIGVCMKDGFPSDTVPLKVSSSSHVWELPLSPLVI